jgi:hypothetical protein
MSSRSAVIALVLAAGLPLPLQAHDIYSHLKDQTGASCCDDRDCRPANYHFTALGLRMFVDGRWIKVPNDRVQYRVLLDDPGETAGGHWCGGIYEGPNPDTSYVTRCAILPPQSASAQ